MYRTLDDGESFGLVYTLFPETLSVRSSCPVENQGPFFWESDQGNDDLYVYRTRDEGASFQQTASLKVIPASARCDSGVLIAVNGDLLVAASTWLEETSSGALNESTSVFVFRTLDGGESFERSERVPLPSHSGVIPWYSVVAVSGNLIVVGDVRACAVSVLRTVDDGATWFRAGPLRAPNDDCIGLSVAIDGDLIAAGGFGPPYEDWDIKSRTYPSTRTIPVGGIVYVFRALDSGASFEQVAKLSLAVPSPIIREWAVGPFPFSTSLALKGDVVVAGSPVDGAPGAGGRRNEGLGRVYTFDLVPSPRSTSRKADASRFAKWIKLWFDAERAQPYALQVFCFAWFILFILLTLSVDVYVYCCSEIQDTNVAHMFFLTATSMCREDAEGDAKNALAQVLFTIGASQFDFASDTLYVGFYSFASRRLFLAACAAYFAPLVAFLAIYRVIVREHLWRIFVSTKTLIVRFYPAWEKPAHCVIEVSSYVLFLVAFAATIAVYVSLLFVFISCKLMCVSYFANLFFNTAGTRCNEKKFRLMFKHNVLIELVFESFAQLIIVIIDTWILRGELRIPSWAFLSILGSGLMLIDSFWPYCRHIVYLKKGLRDGIAAVEWSLKYTPEQHVAPNFVESCLRCAGLRNEASSIRRLFHYVLNYCRRRAGCETGSSPEQGSDRILSVLDRTSPDGADSGSDIYEDALDDDGGSAEDSSRGNVELIQLEIENIRN